MKPIELAGAIVVNTKGQIVVVYNSDAQSWSFPKGHVEVGESHLEAAKRELAEETGITNAEFVGELGSYQRLNRRGTELKNMNMFLFRSSAETFRPTEPKITEVRWATVDEAVKILTHQKDGDFLKSIKESLF